MNSRKFLFALICVLVGTQASCMMPRGRGHEINELDNLINQQLAAAIARMNNDFWPQNPVAARQPAAMRHLNLEDFDRRVHERVHEADQAINNARDDIARSKREWNIVWNILPALFPVLSSYVMFIFKAVLSAAQRQQRLNPTYKIPDTAIGRFFMKTSWSKCALITAVIGAAGYLAIRSLKHTRFGKDISADYQAMIRAKANLRAQQDERVQLYQEIHRRYAAEDGRRANARAHAAELQQQQQDDRQEIAQLQQQARVGQREIRRAERRAEILDRIQHEHPEVILHD